MNQVKRAQLVSRDPATPHFTHDCDKCRYLGRLNGEDLYYCETHDEYVRRFGHMGPCYGSVSADLVHGTLFFTGTPYAFAALLSTRKMPPLAWTAEATPDL